MSNSKGMSIIAIIVPVAVILLFLVAGFFAWQAQMDQSNPFNASTVCTQDVKQCPDGSYVSRSGANCEFAVCPDLGNHE